MSRLLNSAGLQDRFCEYLPTGYTNMHSCCMHCRGLYLYERLLIARLIRIGSTLLQPCNLLQSLQSLVLVVAQRVDAVVRLQEAGEVWSWKQRGLHHLQRTRLVVIIYSCKYKTLGYIIVIIINACAVCNELYQSHSYLLMLVSWSCCS